MSGDQSSRESDSPTDHESNEADVTNGDQNEDWVAASLKQLYQSTVEEGIPDDMLALLDALDEDEEQSDQDMVGNAAASGEASQ